MSRCLLVLSAALSAAVFGIRAGADDGGSAPGRAAASAEPIPFSLNNKPFDEQILTFIAETTGKMVIPVGDPAARAREATITLVSDEPIGREAALDLLVESLGLNGISVVERHDLIIVGRTEELMELKRMPVLTADEDVLHRRDKGSLVIKVFRLDEVDAQTIAGHLDKHQPAHTEITVDPSSNRIVVCGDIAACQQIQRLVDELDHDRWRSATRIFALQHADAGEVAENVADLFDAGPPSAAPPNPGGRSGRRTPGRGAASAGAASGRPMLEVPVKVAVNEQQNNITVQAGPSTMEEIAWLVETAWDLPRAHGTSKLYVLAHTDPIRMRDIVREVLGISSGSGSRYRNRGGGGDGARPDVTRAISGVYRFEAFPDKNALVAISKTREAFAFLDDLVAKLDRPTTIGLPVKVELRHADASRLADEINALLAAGAGPALDRPSRSLNGRGLGDGGGRGGGGTGGGPGGAGRGEEGSRQISFPWQGGRDEERAPESNLIGQVRVVPIVRENALAILAPPAHMHAMRALIQEFDQPARQVMISAVIAEVQLTDDLALGLRVSSGDLPVSTSDNTLALSGRGTGSEEGFLSQLFDSSVLDVSFDVNLVLQALAGHTRVRVLHEPRVFTADNQEAFFFDGQEIPFISDSIAFDQGLNQSFDYRQVGLILNVRPHITARNDVNLHVNLELSSVVPGQTLFGGFILDQRQIWTNVTLCDGQTVVLSGLLRETESQVERSVPLLGDVPLLGELFKSRERSTSTTELLVFLTPHVLDAAAVEQRSRHDLDQLEQIARPLDEHPDPDDARRAMRRRFNPRAARNAG